MVGLTCNKTLGFICLHSGFWRLKVVCRTLGRYLEVIQINEASSRRPSHGSRGETEAWSEIDGWIETEAWSETESKPKPDPKLMAECRSKADPIPKAESIPMIESKLMAGKETDGWSEIDSRIETDCQAWRMRSRPRVLLASTSRSSALTVHVATQDSFYERKLDGSLMNAIMWRRISLWLRLNHHNDKKQQE